MKALIIFDSTYGNTAKIAQAVGEGLGNLMKVALVRVSEVKPEQMAGVRLLILGSPTQRFNATPAMMSFLKGIPQDGLKGVQVAAFDTRLTKSNIEKTPLLAFFVRLSGAAAYAAKHIADLLRKKGGLLVVPPEGFFVEGMEGPLVQGELERAAEWARQISATVQ
jgi:flavodoxin I